jgi:hypothetical protein
MDNQSKGAFFNLSKSNLAPMVRKPIASAASLSLSRLLPARVVSEISRISFEEMSFP